MNETDANSMICPWCHALDADCRCYKEPGEIVGSRDRPDYTLADVMAGLEELNGRLVAMDSVLRALVDQVRAFTEGQVRQKSAERR